MTEDLSFAPQGPARPNQVYVSWQLNKALGYAAKREKCSKEDLFERVMTAYLNAQHCNIVTWMAARESEEKEFVKSLTSHAKPDAA